MERLDTITATPSLFLNKSTYVWGKSGSGKSIGILDILYQIRDHISHAIVFCPTDAQNGVYSGSESIRIPKIAIHDEFDEIFLSQIYSRQEKLATKYSKTQNIGILTPIFMRIATQQEKTQFDRMWASYEECNAKYVAQGESTMPARKTLKNRHEELIRTFLRKMINNKMPIPMDGMSQIEQEVLSDFNLNPRLAIIFDDVSEILRKLKKAETFEKILNKGRHIFITVIFAIHDINAISKVLRPSAANNLFIDNKILAEYYGGGVLVPSNEKKLALTHGREVFTGLNRCDKLIYERDNDRFSKIVIKFHDTFKFPSDKDYWQYCEDYYDENK